MGRKILFAEPALFARLGNRDDYSIIKAGHCTDLPASNAGQCAGVLKYTIWIFWKKKMLIFERMRPEQRRDCSLLAARAQEDYVYLKNYISDDTRRRRFLECALEIEVTINDGNTICLTAKEDNAIAAMAMLCPPGVHRPSVASYLKAGFWKAFWRGGIRDVIAWTMMDDKAGAPCHKLAENAWYLSLLAVDPAKQGKRIGSRFLQECIIPTVKKGGGDKLCLFTNSEINRKFYVKNGFKEFDAREFSYKGKKLGSWSYCIDV